MENKPIPDAELAELRRLYAAATQGRWRGDRYDETVKYWIVIEKSGNLEPVVQLSVRGDDFGASEQDCDWIMAAHNTFPGILARLEAAERERDELRGRVCINAGQKRRRDAKQAAKRLRKEK